MNESNLAVHLGRQTTARFERLDFPFLEAGLDAARGELQRLAATGPGAILLDGASATQMTHIGALLDEQSRQWPGRFVVGPSACSMR
jgi:uncharacterized protein YgbK (DUF1537 family)